VEDLDELGRYPYCGHSVLMGKVKQPWQDTQGVLGMFGEKGGAARRAYRAFVERGLPKGDVRTSRAGASYEAQGDGKG